MNRRDFLQNLGIGAGALIITPSLLRQVSIPDTPMIPAISGWRYRDIWLKIVNTNKTPVNVLLFGIMPDGDKPIVPDGISITTKGDSYENLLKSLSRYKYLIRGIQMRAPYPQQLSPINIFTVNDNGSFNSDMLWMGIYHSAAKNTDIELLVDAPGLELTVSSNVFLTLDVMPQSSLELNFHIEKTEEASHAENKLAQKIICEFLSKNSL
jgi:hypothetical protein